MKNNKSSNKSNLPPLLRLSYVLQHKAEKVLEEEAGISLSAARVMSVLNPNTASSQRDVAMELMQTEANVSRLLQNMKKHSLVSITRNKKDSRQRDVTLTAKGDRQYRQAEKLLKKQQSQFLRMLNASEAKILDQAAQKLA